jgi:hypothetical protein
LLARIAPPAHDFRRMEPAAKAWQVAGRGGPKGIGGELGLSLASGLALGARYRAAMRPPWS